MRGRLLNLLTVADGAGPEFDVSELVTYLNDAVLLAPSMLLRLPVSWTPVDGRSVDVTLADCGHEVTARVFLGAHDAPCDFSTEDRYYDGPAGPIRVRWSTPVRGWHQVNGRWLPSAGSAIWHLPDGPFTYAQFTFRPGDIAYNAPPAELAPGPTPRRRVPSRTACGCARRPRPPRCATGAPPRTSRP
jgi:hypothetical protein